MEPADTEGKWEIPNRTSDDPVRAETKRENGTADYDCKKPCG